MNDLKCTSTYRNSYVFLNRYENICIRKILQRNVHVFVVLTILFSEEIYLVKLLTVFLLGTLRFQRQTNHELQDLFMTKMQELNGQ